MKAAMACIVAAILLVSPAIAAAQKDVTPAMEAAAFKQMATAIPLGSRVKVQTKAGRRLTATLMAVNDDALIVKRAARVPEPAVTIAFAELARLQRDERSGMSIGKALGIGLASGAGAILTMFAIALSIDD